MRDTALLSGVNWLRRTFRGADPKLMGRSGSVVHQFKHRAGAVGTAHFSDAIEVARFVQDQTCIGERAVKAVLRGATSVELNTAPDDEPGPNASAP
jgi:hypothetical protein